MTSALKRVDVAVYNAIQAADHGKLAGGTNKQFGADIGGVGYGKWSPKVPASIKHRGRRPVQAPEGRQDQGHSRDRQVDVSTRMTYADGAGHDGPPRLLCSTCD